MTKRGGNEGRVDVGWLALAVFAAGVVGCRTDLLKEQAPAAPGRSAARVDVLQGSDCGNQASLVTPPEHCAWPEGATRTQMLSATMQVVARVGPDGRAESVRVVSGPEGHEFDDAAVQTV